MKKICSITLWLLTLWFTFAETFPSFPMTIYWEIKIWNNPLEWWTISINDSLDQELVTYEITEPGKYWSDNVSKLPLLLNDFEWNITFKVSHNWKTYMVDSIDDSNKKDTCPNWSSITFISDNCRYDIILKEEIIETDTWIINTWNSSSINWWESTSRRKHWWASRKRDDDKQSLEWEHFVTDEWDETETLNNPTDEEEISINSEEIQENWFSKELNDAFDFSYKNWITKKDNINDANMKWELTRISAAKMLSQYAMNVLWKEPDVSKWVLKFDDVTKELNEKYDNAITLAYQLWIMWQNLENGQFKPYDTITRWEFSTALSRMLYGTKNWANYFYTTHINKLKQEWIIKDINPNKKEIRWYAMLMLMRASKTQK